MALFDTERILKNAVAMVKDKLNAQIVIIDTEKADFSLAPLNSAAYYFGSMPKGAFNFNPFLVYGFMENPKLEGVQEGNSVKVISLYFEIVLVDGGSKDDENITYKLLRYGRALEEIFSKNGPKIMEGFGTLQVTSLAPTNIFNMDGKIVRSAGANITARVTAR